MRLLVEGGVYIITWGVYDDYQIEMATTNFRKAVEYFRDFDPPLEKRIEVWLEHTLIGHYTEVVAKSEWNVQGELIQTMGLQWNPEPADE